MVQRAVILALFHREIKTRFAGYRLGLAWALLEPVAHIGTFLIIFGFRHNTLSNGIDYPIFLVTGFLPFFLFSHCVTQVMKAPEGNQGLFGFRQVRPIDTMLSRFVVETFISTVTFFLFLFLFGWFGHEVIPHQPLEFLTAFLLLGVLGFGLGLCFATAETLITDFSKFSGFLMRPLYFMSGIMFSINTVPPELRHYLTWNPVLHCIETIRQSMFHTPVHADVSLSYAAECTIILLFTGFSLYSLHWKKMIRV